MNSIILLLFVVSLEEYLPLNEVIPEAAEVSDIELGDVYNYHVDSNLNLN